jgi:spermidine/putrescine ABC transporter ATP-binding subunit
MVILEGVSKRFGEVHALRRVSLEIHRGEFFALLGPSGSGKSTLLGLIAGFHRATAGRIAIDGVDVTGLPAYARNLGMVFQNYSLFPHLDVRDNVGFGLRMRRRPRAEIAERVDRALRTVRLETFGDRRPTQLSGGQQQRVALARALVIEPKVLLLDEPLAALDKKLRDEMRAELKEIQRATGVTTVFVTHDQEEALALADRVAVMHDGQLEQCGEPDTIYRRPATRFVATFMGDANLDWAVVAEASAERARLEVASAGCLWTVTPSAPLAAGQKVEFYVRPQHLRIATPSPSVAGLRGTVTARAYLGRYTEITVRLASGAAWRAQLMDGAPGAASAPGDDVVLSAEPHAVVALSGA